MQVSNGIGDPGEVVLADLEQLETRAPAYLTRDPLQVVLVEQKSPQTPVELYFC